MKLILAAPLLLAAMPAAAQTAPAPATTPAPAPAPAAKLSTHLPLEQLMANPAGRAAVLKAFPGLDENPMYETLKGKSLREISPMAGGTIPESKLDEIDAELAAAK
jgi:hypothetical protein